MTKFLSSSQLFSKKGVTRKSKNMLYVKPLFATIVLMLCSVYNMMAQVSVTATGGTTSASYTTLATALDSINFGVHTGAVTVALSTGSETAPATGLVINGSGVGAASYTSLSIAATTAGTYTINAGVGTATPASATPDGILELVGADNVTIDGLTLTDGNATNPGTMEYGIGLFKASATDGCQNNIIRNNVISLKTINNAAGTAPMMDGSVGILMINATNTAATTAFTITGAGGANANNSIQNNTVSFCNTAIGLSGFAATNIANADVNNIVGGAGFGNTVSNFGGTGGATVAAAGIRLLNQWSYEVSYNTVNNNTGTGANHVTANRGIFCQTQAAASGTITNNTVTMKNGGTAARLSCIENVLSGSANISLSNTLTISNNTIQNCAVFQGTITPNSFYGIVNNGHTPYTLNMNNNTFTGNTSAATTDSTILIANYTSTSGYSQGAINMNNNNISGFTFNGTAVYSGAFTGIHNRMLSTTVQALKPDLSISNNTVTGIAHPATLVSTGITYVISNTGSPAAATYYSKVRMSSNFVGNMTLNNSTTHGMIYNSFGGVATSLSMDSNRVENITRIAATSGTFYGIFNAPGGAAAGLPVNFRNNKVNNVITNAGTGSFFALYCLAYSTSPFPLVTLSFDTVTNVKVLGTGVLYNIYYAYIGNGLSGQQSNINDNLIQGNRGGGTWYGLYGFSTSGTLPFNVYNNRVWDDTTTGVSSLSYLMYVSPSSPVNIYKNNIANIYATGATSPTLYSLYLTNSSGTPANVYNNFISNIVPLNSPSTLYCPVFGIYQTGTAQANIYNNTIKLDSNGFRFNRNVGMAGLAFAGSNPTLINLYNNIFYCNSFGNATAMVSAVRKLVPGGALQQPGFPQYQINNNLYYAPVTAGMVNTFLFSEGSSVAALQNGYNIAGLTNSTTPNIKNDPLFNTGCGLYKAFIGFGRESNTFRDSNLVAGALPNTWVPTGTCYAESGAVPVAITGLTITDDYSGAARNPSTPDIGALEFSGTPLDAAPPSISYTSIPNSICGGNPTLTATITDVSGVNFTTPTKPRLWYKKYLEANVFSSDATGTNNSTFNGWKSVEATNTSSPFIFIMDYSKLFSGAPTVGDTMMYFVTAQDLAATPNVAVNTAAYPAGYCPTSDTLDPAAFPILNTNKFYLLPTPFNVATAANPQYICNSGSTVLSLTGDAVSGATYQWQFAPYPSGSWTNITGATSSTYSLTSITSSTQFRAIILCGGVPIPTGSPSVPVSVIVNTPVLNSAPNVSRCGPGTVTLTASVNAGSTAYWYGSATGDTVFATGSSVVSGGPTGVFQIGTNTVYVDAGTACNPFSFNFKPSFYYFNTTTTGYGHFFDVLSPGGITIDSVDVYAYNATAGTTGTVTFQVINAAGIVTGTYGPYTVNNYTVNTNGGPVSTPTRIGLVGGSCNGIKVPMGNGYRLVVSAMTNTSLMYFYNGGANLGYPYLPNGTGICQVTAGCIGSATQYNYYSCGMYNWKVSARCETSRLPVTVTVTVPPAVTITGTPAGTLCLGTSDTLTASSSNPSYDYTWSPSGTTVNPKIFNVTGNQIYTVSALDASTGSYSGCVATATYAVAAFAPAPFIGLSNSNPAVCAGGASTLTVIDSTSFVPSIMPTGYGVSSAGSTADEEIFNFTMGTINQTSTCASTGGGAANGLPASVLSYYSNYTALPASIYAPGAVATFSLTLGYCGTFAFTNTANIYVDFNRNGLFTDPGENVYTKPSGPVTVTGQVFTGSFTVPTTAQLGLTLLRIVYVEGASPPTGTYTWGETEDYPIKIGYPNSPATAYAWTASQTTTFAPPAANAATEVVSNITSTTNFTVTASDANGCTATQTAIVAVGPIACNPITSSKPQACAGDCVTLTANPSAGATPYSYKWTNAAGVIIGLTKNISPCPTTTTTYNCTVYSAAGCVDSCTTSYTQIVNVLPVVSVVNAAGGPIQICGTNSTSVTLNGTGGTTYTFTPTSNVSPSTGAGPFTVSTPSTATYTVTGASAVGCTATTTVTVNYLPDYALYTAATPQDLCPGGSAVICVTDTNKGVCAPSTLYVTPTHTAAGPCLDTVKIGAYTDVTGTSCTLPSYSANIGSSVTNIVRGANLNVTTTIAPFGYSAVWIDYNNNGTFDATEYTSMAVNTNAASAIIAIPATATPGCTRMRVRSRGTSIASTDGSTNFADGETQDYLVTIVGANYTSITSYTWSQVLPPATNNLTGATNTQCVSATNVQPVSFPFTFNGYLVTVTDANGCTKQSTAAVYVLPLTCTPITNNGTDTVCKNVPRILTANRTGGGAPFTYAWTSSITGSTIIGTGKTLTIPDTVSGVVTYTVVISDGCSPQGSCSSTKSIFVLDAPVLTLSISNNPQCVAGTSIITCNTTGGFGLVNYITPYPTPAGLTGVGPFSWVPGTSNVFTITATDQKGCKGTATANMVYSPPFGVAASGNPTSIGPCGGTVTLTTSDTASGPQVLPTGYGVSAATSTADEEILGFSFGSTSTTSTCTTTGGGANMGLPASTLSFYSNYTAIPAPTFVSGQNVPFSLTLGYCGATAWTNTASIYVDFNRNGVFNLPQEQVYAKPSGAVTVTGQTFTGSFTIPANATPGLTLLRVVYVEGASPPTGTYTWGETEDYAVNILGTSLYPVVNKTWSHDSASVIITDGSYTYPATSLVVNPPGTQSSTIYTVVATNSVGCTATSTVQITVGPVNCGPATVSLASICSGKADTLKINPILGGSPYTYSWADSATNAVVGTAKNTVIFPSNSGTTDSIYTYICTVTDACGLTCTNKVSITVKPLPVISITNSLGSAAICGTGCATLTAVPNTFPTNVWSPAPTTGAGTATVTSCYPTITANTIYTLTVTGTNACTNTATSLVVYSPPFFTTATSNPPFIGCGTTITLTAIDTIVASGPQGMPSGYGVSAATSNVDEEILGFTLGSISTTSTCATTGGPAQNGLPASALNFYSNYTNLMTNLVVGTTNPFTLTLGYCGATAWTNTASIYVDWDRNGVFNTTLWNATTAPMGELVYQKPSGPVTVTGQTFTGNITVPSSVIPGKSLLRVVYVEGASPPTGTYLWGETEDYAVNLIGFTQDTANTFVWNPGNKPGRTVTDSISVFTTYTVTSTNALGCTTTATVAVNVSPLAAAPIVALGGKDSICSGLTTTLIASTAGGGIPTYSWSGPGIIGSPNAATTTVSYNNFPSNVQTTHVYTVTITDACNATTSATFTLKVNPGPQWLSLTATPNTICFTGSSLLNAIATSPNSTIANPAGYTWSGPNAAASLSTLTGTSPVSTPAATSDYVCTVADANGCTATSSVTVQFSPTYSLNAFINPNSIGTCGGTVTLTVQDTVNGPQVMPSPYCATTNSGGAGSMITNVTFGTINNPSGTAITYTTYTNTVAAATVLVGQTYPISISIDAPSTYAGAITSVWIDFNRDGLFAATEWTSVFNTAGPYIIGGTTATANITIPSTASSGLTTMRVRTRGNGNVNGAGNACLAMGSGETEEYAINILSAPPVTITNFTWADNQGNVSLVNGTSGKTIVAVPTTSTTYTVTATNAFGCTATSTVVVNQTPFALTSVTNKSTTNPICVGKCDTVKVKYTGGGSPYTVSFTPNTNVTQINDSIWTACPTATTSYTVSVSDVCGTSSTASITVNMNPSPTVTISPDSVIRCNGAGPVTIGAVTCLTCNTTVWQPGGNTNAQFTTTLSGTTTYTVTGTDFFGCTATATQKAWISYPHNINITSSPATICNGDSANLAFTDTSLQVGSATPPAGYCTPGTTTSGSDYFTNVTFATINNSTGNGGGATGYAGLYSTPIPTINCTSTYTMNVTINNAGSEQAGLWIDWNANGIFDATEYYSVPTVLNGASTAWNGTLAITPPSNAVAGTVRMRVRCKDINAGGAFLATDACASYTWGETEDYLLNVTCNAPSNNASWAWASTPSSTVTSTNPGVTSPLTANTDYTLTVADASGCTYTKTKSVNVNPAITINSNIYNLKCFNVDDGSIKILTTGGTQFAGNPKYNFGYYDPNTTGVITLADDTLFGLHAGTYTLQATDAVGCVKTATALVTRPDSFYAVVQASSSSCFGGTSGPSNCQIYGGVAPFTSIWLENPGGSAVNSTYGPDTIVSTSGLTAGCYRIYVADNNGCYISPITDPFVDFCITQPTAPLLLSASITDTISCHGANTATVTLGATGGSPGYLYSADSGFNYQASPVFANLSAGTYYFYVKDTTNICNDDTMIVIGQPTMIVDTLTTTNPLCNGGCGTASYSAIGGTGALTYTVNGLPAPTCYTAASYVFVATDANGCSASKVGVIVDPALLEATGTSTDALCNGANGTVSVSYTGGTTPITVTIDNSAPAVGYAAGDHYIVVTDNNGCTVLDTVTITQPTAITQTASTTDAACNNADGTITISATGGTGTLVHTTTGPVTIANNTATNFAAGNWLVTTTDSNGCAEDTLLVIAEPTAVVVTATKVNPNCYGLNGTITANATGGTGAIVITQGANTLVANTSYNYLAAAYLIVATDANGCSGNTIAIITNPDSITQTITNADPTCFGGNGILTLVSTGGTGTLADSINGQVAPLASYPAGTYVVSTTDANGCNKVATVTITDPAQQFLTVNVAQALCVGDTNLVTITSTGGTGQGSILINGYGTYLSPTSLPSGLYIVTASDAVACTITESFVVNPTPSAIATTFIATQPNCPNDLGSIAYTVGGGTPNYVVYMNSNPISGAQGGLAAGSYTFNTIDINNCVKNDTVTIDAAPAPIVITETVVNPSCGSSTTGTIAVAVAGGNSPYNVTIDGAPIAATYTVGSHTITVLDGHGCVESKVVTIISAAVYGVFANASDTTICNTTTVTLTGADTANAGLTYTWLGSDGSTPTNAVPFVLSATNTYTVTGTSVTGCAETAVVIVTVANSGNQLSQASILNTASLAGNGCSPNTLTPDGSMVSYSDGGCNLIATVQDGTGGNTLGNVNACVNVTSTVQSWNNQPYTARTYTITPTNQGPADVTLYFTNDDIMDYNTYAPANTLFPAFNNPNGLSPMDNDLITNASITKIDGGGLGIGTVTAVIPVTLHFDSARARWYTTFPVASFSGFFLHTTNPNNVPLSVNVLSFNGHKEGSSDVLNWSTSSEKNNKLFQLQHSTVNPNAGFTTIATVNTKAVNGNSSSTLNYQSINNKPVAGHNYYRLLEVSQDNVVTMSKTIDIQWNFDGTQVTVYPNPSHNELHVDVNIDKNTMATIRVLDVTGKLVKQIETELTKGMNSNTIDLGEIANGVYMLKITDGKGLNYSQQFRKQ
jgi:hypothetical protein